MDYPWHHADQRCRDADEGPGCTLHNLYFGLHFSIGHPGVLATPTISGNQPAAVRGRKKRKRMIYEYILAIVVLVSLIFYALGGGADFGGGIWDLLAIGPRALRQ